MPTTRGWGLPAPSYSVVTPAWLSDTQIGLPGPTDVPQGFFRFASVCAASPGISETRFVWAYDRVAIAPRPAEAGVTIPEETIAADTAAKAASATTKLRTLMVLPFSCGNESADRSRGHPPVRPREIVERSVVASPSRVARACWLGGERGDRGPSGIVVNAALLREQQRPTLRGRRLLQRPRSGALSR